MKHALIAAALVLTLGGCVDRPIINSGSYDWTDQVRGPDGNPLPGWGTIIEPSGGGGMGR